MHIYILYCGLLSQSLDVYAREDVDYIGNHDTDYLLVKVLKKFASSYVRYLNIDNIAYKFSHEGVEPFTYRTSDDDVWKLLDILVEKHYKELHLYVIHYINVPTFVPLESLKGIGTKVATEMGIESQDEDMTKVWGSDGEDVAAEDEEEGEDIGVGDGD